jgi:hypothetical protein
MSDEMKCPKCGNDLKEYVTRFRCRNLECLYEFKKLFPGGMSAEDGIAQGRREAAEAAVALLRSLGPEEEWNEERLCQAILGTASAEKTDKGEI